jgi:hypothetical protein
LGDEDINGKRKKDVSINFWYMTGMEVIYDAGILAANAKYILTAGSPFLDPARSAGPIGATDIIDNKSMAVSQIRSSNWGRLL